MCPDDVKLRETLRSKRFSDPSLDADKPLSRAFQFIESRRISILIALGLLSILIPFYIASQRLFWNDELYTLYFARLSPADLWHALGTGADQIPPTFVLFTRLSLKIFGENKISLRLPELLAFVGTCLCLYKIISARMPALYGFLAMLFPTISAALAYSYEARGYSLLLLFSALAFYCWQQSSQHGKNKIAVFGLAIALSGALMSHYYGIFIFFPIVLGELVRTRAERKVRLSIWVAIAISLAPLVLFLPLIQASASYGGSFWAKPEWQDVFNYYEFLLKPAALVLLISLLVVGFASISHETEERQSNGLHPWEWTAAVGFVLIPIVCVAGAKIANVGLTARHVLPAIIGFSIIVPSALYSGFGSRNGTLLALPVFLLGFLGNGILNLSAVRTDNDSYERTVSFLKENATNDLPIVSWFVQPAQQVWYYGPTDLSNRLYYLPNSQASLRYVGHDTIDRSLIEIKSWFSINKVEPYGAFLSDHPQFLLYYCAWEDDWKWNWIISSLLSDHFRLELISRRGDQYLFMVRNVKQE